MSAERAHIIRSAITGIHRLLPEADPQGDLFQGAEACGNASRKAYLCNANTNPDEIIAYVGARTVHSTNEIDSLARNLPILAIRFRLDRVLPRA